VTEALTIQFKPSKVQPETLTPKAIAEVTFDRKYLIKYSITVAQIHSVEK